MKNLQSISASFLLIIISCYSFGQTNITDNNNRETETQVQTKKTEVVVNQKMVAKYKKFQESGEYVSLWETVKDYNYEELTAYYKTYRNYEFTDDTTYPDVKLAHEMNKSKEEKTTAISSNEEDTDTAIEYLSEVQVK